MLKRSATVLALLAMVMASGCAMNKGEGGRNCPENAQLVGTAVGTGLGAGVGSLIAHAMGRTRILRGTAIGAGAGALLGSLVGGQMEKACLEEEIARLTKELDDARAQLKACQDENARLKARIAELEAQLANMPKGNNGDIIKQGQITLSNDVLFRPGSDKLSTAGRALLDQAAQEIKDKYANSKVSIEGHCDSDPIRVSHWKSNWELGAARAIAVLHYLEDKHGVQGNILSATTYSFHRPVADNGSAEGKAKNRRSEIVLYTTQQ